MTIQTDKFAAAEPERLISAGKESNQEDVLERALRPRHSVSRRLRIGAVVTQMTPAKSSVPVNGISTAMQPINSSATMAIWMSCF